ALRVRGFSLRHAPDRIRTCDLWLRRPTLYPAELRARKSGGGISRVLSRSRGEDHFSANAVSGAVKQPTRDSDGAGNSSSLFGLAPGGVYRAAPVTGRAVRSYRTVSPLPVPPREGHRRSALCCTFRRLATPGRYPAPCPAELGLSSTPKVPRSSLAPR